VVGREKGGRAGVQDVELQEVVGEGIVEEGVLGVEPLAVHDVARPERLEEPRLVAGSPGLEEVELLLPLAAIEEVPATLEAQLARRAEADADVSAVELLLDDQVAAGEGAEGDAR